MQRTALPSALQVTVFSGALCVLSMSDSNAPPAEAIFKSRQVELPRALASTSIFDSSAFSRSMYTAVPGEDESSKSTPSVDSANCPRTGLGGEFGEQTEMRRVAQASRQRTTSRLAPAYAPRRPHETALYRLVKEHGEEFLRHARETHDGPLPR